MHGPKLLSEAESQASGECRWAAGLPSPVPRGGWSQGRTPMATAAVRCCFHDAQEWLVSWIWTELSDSAGGGGGTLPHLGEEALAGCEMLLNKVIPRVIVRPVTCHPPTTTPFEEFTAGASCLLWRILGVNSSFVWDGSLTLSLSASARAAGESSDNYVLVWKTYKSEPADPPSVNACLLKYFDINTFKSNLFLLLRN